MLADDVVVLQSISGLQVVVCSREKDENKLTISSALTYQYRIVQDRMPRRNGSCNTPDDNDAKKPNPPEQVHQDRRRPRRRSIRDPTQQTANKRADLTSSFGKKSTQEQDGRRRRLSLSLSDILKKSDTSSKTLDKQTPISQVR